MIHLQYEIFNVVFFKHIVMAKVFSLPIEIDQQDNVKSGAVNIIDEMKNMMEKTLHA